MTKSNENLSFGLGSAKLADELAGRSEVPVTPEQIDAF